MDDPGLLRCYPRSSCEELGLRPRVTSSSSVDRELMDTVISHVRMGSAAASRFVVSAVVSTDVNPVSASSWSVSVPDTATRTSLIPKGGT